MKKTICNLCLSALVLNLAFISCSTEEQIIEDQSLEKVSFATANLIGELPEIPDQLLLDGIVTDPLIDDFPFDLASAVEPSECGPTTFDAVISRSVSSNLDALGAQWFDLWSTVNQLYTFIDEDPQFFGANGEYTRYMAKRTRNLEKFWDMPEEITVRGQHNSTLGDRDKIALVYIVFAGLPEEIAYANADFFLAVNEASTFLIESPLLSFDGFASSSNLIVIGDGLVELASEAGVEDKVVWSGILSHEWAHQIQFDNFPVWYPDGAADNEPEATRTTELEADFFAAYYMTHKGGATYNWKRAEDFFELFFNIGDCGFTSPGHHGTPLQRMEAARQGYLLAQNAPSQGHILSPDDVHDIFLDTLNDIVSGGAVAVKVIDSTGANM